MARSTGSMSSHRGWKPVALSLLACLGAVACAPDDPVSPVLPIATQPPVAFATVGTTSDPAGVAFLPPLGPPTTPGTAAPLDRAALPFLVAEICEWNGIACALPLVRRIPASPDGIQVAPNGDLFEANWRVRGTGVRAGATYRLRILASGQEMGSVDFRVVNPEPRVNPLPPGQVLLNSTLAIRFTLATGVGQPAGAAGGTISLAGGQVALDVPAGALPKTTFLTALPASSQLPAGGPAVVPGTAWDFGPSGTQFAQPVTMTIAYDPAQLPNGVVESELRIHKLVNGAYVQQNAGAVDLTTHTVSAQVTSFSVYVLLQRQFPGSQEDLTGPMVQSVLVLDAASGQYGMATTLDVSGADVTLTARIAITDDISGVNLIYVIYRSPSGRQVRYPCRPDQSGITPPPNSGSDTNGEWDCVSTWPRYGEPGLWIPNTVQVQDRVGNWSFYYAYTSGGTLCLSPTGAPCLGLPQITVVSSPADITPPVAVSLQVSLDAQPRNFGGSVSLDVSASGRYIVFGLQATDDLSGLAQGTPWSVGSPYVYLGLTGPSRQNVSSTCWLNQGTTVNGFFECYAYVPQLAENGTWTVNYLILTDRVGNRDQYYQNATGQFCSQLNVTQCIIPPTVQVSSVGDANAPLLQTVSLSVNNNVVTGALTVTDDLSGATNAYLYYRSATSTQTQYCWASRTSGTALNGDWSCDVTFSQYAARGQWFLEAVYLYDAAGNTRAYQRQQGSTDTMCYYPPTGAVCQAFGSLEVIVQ